MRARSVYEYYWFGTCLRYLQDADTQRPVHGDAHVLFNLDRFFHYLDDLGLVVTSRAASDLRLFRDALAQLPADNTLSETGAATLSALMRDVRRTLEAELQGFEVYVVTPKTLDVTKLMADVPALFESGAYQALPDLARYDFGEAARCIAFERPTAAAYHILRATECVLRGFYCAFVSRNRLKPLLWGPVVADLRKRRATKKHVTLLNHLDNIRLSFRNPTQHPDMMYSIHEAQDLWALCVEAVNRMVRTLRTDGRELERTAS